jgi:suppressor of ftsI
MIVMNPDILLNPEMQCLAVAMGHPTAMRRRDFLAAGCPGGMTALGAGMWPGRAYGGDLLVQPTELRSRNGVLAATLTAAPGTVRLDDVTFPGLLYNGAYLPPLLRVRAGDSLRIHFKNDLLEDPSNLHYHGLPVSPRGNSDNVFIHVHPGQDFAYEVDIPETDRQGPGLFWYHPHVHGLVAKQMLGGLSGGLVVDGTEQYFPIVADIPERFLFIKHAELDERDIVSINGQLNPVIAIKPGEAQFWRIAHIGATMFLKIPLRPLTAFQIAADGHPFARPKPLTELFIGPGERVDAIVFGPPAGEYPLSTASFTNQAWKLPGPAQQIATIAASGPHLSNQPDGSRILEIEARGPRWIDQVRGAPIARRRTLSCSRSADRKMFMIDGRVMDESRVDQTVRLGDTEKWTVVNTDEQYHSFHIHQTSFLVTEVNGVPKSANSLRDTVSIPPATEVGPGSLKVVIPFTDPVILGKFVYHCHAVDHEDKGMMGIVEVAA